MTAEGAGQIEKEKEFIKECGKYKLVRVQMGEQARRVKREIIKDWGCFDVCWRCFDTKQRWHDFIQSPPLLGCGSIGIFIQTLIDDGTWRGIRIKPVLMLPITVAKDICQEERGVVCVSVVYISLGLICFCFYWIQKPYWTSQMDPFIFFHFFCELCTSYTKNKSFSCLILNYSSSCLWLFHIILISIFIPIQIKLHRNDSWQREKEILGNDESLCHNLSVTTCIRAAV